MRKFSARVFGARHRGSRRARGERGAVLVETAIILPLLVLLIGGIVEFGMTFREASTITASTRAGARIASAMPRQATFSQSTADAVSAAIQSVPTNEPQELWIYDATTTTLPSTCTTATKCNKYTWNQTSKTFVLSSTGYTIHDQNACAGAAGQIGVYVTGVHTGLWPGFPSRTLTSKTIMRLEPMPSTSTCSG